MKMPDIVVDMSRGDGGDSNQSCWGFVLPCFLFLGSHSAQRLTSSEEKSKRRNIKKMKKKWEKKKGSEWAVPAAICVRALQKSTFYATHLIFRGWHDVTGIRMKQFVHLYLPMAFRFAVKQKKKIQHTHTSCHMEGKTCWKTKGWAKGKLEIPIAQGLMT